MPRVIPTAAYAPSSAKVITAPRFLTVFLSRSVYGWRPGGVLTGSLNCLSITEEPMIIKSATKTWVGEVRPEWDKLKITQEGKPPILVDAASVSLYTIESSPSNEDVATYECDIDGHCTCGNSHLSDLLGLPPSEIEGIGWLRAVGKDATEKQQSWLKWKLSVEQLSLHSQSYTVINQATMNAQLCRTLATIDMTGRRPLYRGIVFPDERYDQESLAQETKCLGVGL